MNEIIKRLEETNTLVLSLTTSYGQNELVQRIYNEFEDSMVALKENMSFLDLFKPVVFNSREELLHKAQTFDVLLCDEATIISYFVHISGKICRKSNARLFYLKCDLLAHDIESLADHNFKPFFGRTNVYLANNGFHGSLLIVENIKDSF